MTVVALPARTQRAAEPQTPAVASCRWTTSIAGSLFKGEDTCTSHTTDSWAEVRTLSLSFMPGSRWCSQGSGAPDFHQSPTPWHPSWSLCTGRWMNHPHWTVSLLLHRNPPDCRHCLIASSLPPWMAVLFVALFPPHCEIIQRNKNLVLETQYVSTRRQIGWRIKLNLMY